MPNESTAPITILYADDHIVVIDKPPAMLTHANSFDRHSPTVVMVLGSRLGARVYNVHRLDRMTTGAMVLARHSTAARELSRQFREREVDKRYLALVRGHLDDAGTVELPIAGRSTRDAQRAITDYRTLDRGRVAEPIGRYREGWFSLVELSLHTGRSHQARRHLHRINHPVIGDNKHGDREYNRWAWKRLGERHLFLRAVALRFAHPASGEPMEASTAVTEPWERLLAEVGIAVPEHYRGASTFARASCAE
ncbi:MAG: RluA family pseudouridine synthase [Spirochaetota bacterium]